MEINQTKVVKVNAKTLKIHVKVTDRFIGGIYDEQDELIHDFEDGSYVPSFMPGDHFGDYIILDIDLDTGNITNWKRITAEMLEDAIKPED